MRKFFYFLSCMLMLLGVASLCVFASSLFNKNIADGLKSTADAISEAILEASEDSKVNEFLKGADSDN